MDSIKNAINNLTQGISSVDPTNIAMNNLQQTLSGLGGGLGSVILSIPGIGQPVVDNLNLLRKKAEDTLANARSMTPQEIQNKNDEINAEYQSLLAQAQANGTTPPPAPDNPVTDTEASFSNFFQQVFSNTLYISIFVVCLFLGLIGSSIAANSAGIGAPFYYYIYYMVYGFLLFPLSIIIGIYKYYALGKRPMFHAVWAPIFKGNYMGIFQYDLTSTSITHYTSQSTAKPLKV